MRSLAVALRFLTRLPAPAVRAGAPELGASLLWYPLVGALLGVIAAGAGAVLAAGTPLLGAAAAVAVLAGLSGGLHLDGLADTADAWVGGLGDRERTLAIMKDPSCGPAGVSAITGVMLLKAGAAAALVVGGGWPGIVLAATLARGAVPVLFACTPYVRSGGMGSPLASHGPGAAVIWPVAGTAVFCLFLGRAGVLGLLVSAVLLGLLRAAFRRRIGGTTGDTAGAVIELVETAALMT
ncbi:MAG: adenosylcobinamide-GDP ribazoletransferase, partial [Ectothiorhodospiraceae bacterium]